MNTASAPRRGLLGTLSLLTLAVVGCSPVGNTPAEQPTVAETTVVEEAVATVTTTTTPRETGTTETTTDRQPVQETERALVDQPLISDLGVRTGRSAAFAGEVFQDSVLRRGNVFGSDVAYVEYNLGNNYSTLVSVLGIDDNAEESNQYAVVKFYLDNQLVSEERAEFAAPVEVEVDIAGATRLRIEFHTYDALTNEEKKLAGAALGGPMLIR